ncbi:GDP-mannose pyrophosphatase nudK [Serratia quinivorans]|nr:GDP-mannose pyrophosphatase nudK [Serratia quinivorans]VEI69169.1 GDP-mannose pyrophosphatase nudK [Serratia quinivorans]
MPPTGSVMAAGWKEDLEVIELPLTEALSAIAQGTIVDAKTIMLLQFVALNHTLRNVL